MGTVRESVANTGKWALFGKRGRVSDSALLLAPSPALSLFFQQLWSGALGIEWQSLIYMEGCDREMSNLKRYFAILINFVAACQQIKKPALQEASAVCGWVSGARLWGGCAPEMEGEHSCRQLCEMSPGLPRLLGSPF